MAAAVIKILLPQVKEMHYYSKNRQNTDTRQNLFSDYCEIIHRTNIKNKKFAAVYNKFDVYQKHVTYTHSL